MNANKQLAVKALEQYRGDDLYRARAAFRNCTPEQMRAAYGQSGKTRAEILAEYEQHDKAVSDALEWLASVKD